MNFGRVSQLALLSTFIVLTGCSATEDSATTDDGSEVIRGGSPDIKDVPWTIALLGERNIPFCSGALLSDQWVLTSQHCLEGRSAGFKIAAGFDDLRYVVQGETAGSDGLIGGGSGEGEELVDGEWMDGQISTVDSIQRLAGYESPEKGKDLALIHLVTPLVVDDFAKRVLPIKLPEATDIAAIEDQTQAGAGGTVSGWGATSEDDLEDPADRAISSGDVTFGLQTGAQNQADELGLGVTISSEQIHGAYGAELSPGDMGGPLMVSIRASGASEAQDYLAGVASWSLGKHSGTLFQSVVPHLAWIKATVEGSSAADK